MKKPKRNAEPRKRHPRVKTVVADGIVRVKVPPGTLPVVAHHPDRNVVEVIPMPKPRKPTWWENLFGTETIRD